MQERPMEENVNAAGQDAAAGQKAGAAADKTGAGVQEAAGTGSQNQAMEGAGMSDQNQAMAGADTGSQNQAMAGTGTGSQSQAGAGGQEAEVRADKDGTPSGRSRLISLLTSEGMRYLFIGGCTTLVNLVVYAVLCRVVRLNVNISNIISVSVSILFAYVTNKLVVFRSHCSSPGELAAECARFIGARLATMVIEVGGVFVLYNILHQNEMVAKLATQVLVVIGNYFISRFIVFRDRT